MSEPVTIGGLRVAVLGISQGKPLMYRDGEAAGIGVEATEESLLVRLRVDNTNAATLVRFRSWANGPAVAKLTDEHGNKYQGQGAASFHAEGGQGSGTVRPGESTTDVLLFEVPVDAAQRFRLELKHPEADLEPFRFEFARAAIAKGKEGKATKN
jgi:hypothetical protein